jgi:membrane protein CcdC involved in cytochrome C biogenesis
MMMSGRFQSWGAVLGIYFMYIFYFKMIVNWRFVIYAKHCYDVRRMCNDDIRLNNYLFPHILNILWLRTSDIDH